MTENKNFEEQAKRNEKLLAMGELASGVAHELNNPLSNISSSCQLLMEELTEAQNKPLIELVRYQKSKPDSVRFYYIAGDNRLER